MTYLHKRQIATSHKTCMEIPGGNDTGKLYSM